VAVIPFCAPAFPRDACLGGELYMLCLASSLVRTGREGIDCGRVSQKPRILLCLRHTKRKEDRTGGCISPENVEVLRLQGE
jgi:hypothetical protein